MMAGVAVLMMMWLTVFVDETMSLDNTKYVVRLAKNIVLGRLIIGKMFILSLFNQRRY